MNQGKNRIFQKIIEFCNNYNDYKDDLCYNDDYKVIDSTLDD